MDPALLTLTLRYEEDVVTARQRAGQIAALLGFETAEQTRIATAVSEIVRNAFRYAGSGIVEYRIIGETPPQVYTITVTDPGPGIRNLDDILAGRYRSTTGMGIGLVGARRLMDQCDIDSSSTGTTVVLKKILPRRAPYVSRSAHTQIARELTARRPGGLVEEVQKQNQELMRALEEVSRRQEELVSLRQFLTNMAHDFLMPVNAILELASLLERKDRPEPEVQHIRRAAEQLSERVNDLRSTFEAAIPVRDRRVRATADGTSSTPSREEVTHAARTVTRVLLIDDQPAFRDVLGEILERSRYTIADAETAEEGLRKAHFVNPDVILLDLGLPDLAGGEVLRRLKLDPVTAHIPVIVLTSMPAAAPAVNAVVSLAASVVSKHALTRPTITQAIAAALVQPRV